MPHTHHPDGAGPVCRFATKKACDEHFATWKREQKAEYEAKLEQREADRKAEREQRYQAYWASEERRIAAILLETRYQREVR